MGWFGVAVTFAVGYVLVLFLMRWAGREDE